MTKQTVIIVHFNSGKTSQYKVGKSDVGGEVIESFSYSLLENGLIELDLNGVRNDDGMRRTLKTIYANNMEVRY